MYKIKILFVNLIIFCLAAFFVVWISYVYIYPIFGQKNLVFKEVVAQETDKIPPKIFNVLVEDISATSTTISWQTDKETDSLINYNISRDYGIVRDAALTKTHKLVISDLQPSLQYYYRITSIDKDGNQSISNDYTFKSFGEEEKISPPDTDAITPLPGETPTEDKGPGRGEGEGGTGTNENDIAEQVVQLLEEISSEEGLALIESKIETLAAEKARPPVISGDFAKVEVGVDWAKISWKTDKDSNSIVALASDSEYAPNTENPYRWKQGEPDEMVLVHEVTVMGLKPATTYHYQVQSKSVLGLESASDDNTFRTKSILPEIYNIRLAKVEEDSATIEFETNVPCSAIIEYTDLNTDEVKIEGSPTLVTVNSIRIKDLKFDTYYSAVIKVENEQNEKTISEPITFTTVKDVLAPVISKINTESTLFPGTENKTQTIISWRTDEVAICQLIYRQGPASEEDSNSLPEEEDYVTNHVQVVTDFLPATVYKFLINCKDKTSNSVKSEEYTMLTPAREQSILDLIIKNFEGTFGWLKKK